MGNYNVVFQYTRETGGYEGVITWTSFPDKEYFENWYTPNIEKRQRAIAKGVTPEEAIKLTRQTPRACRIASCLEEATMDDGSVNKKILDMKLQNVFLGEILEKEK